MNDVEVTKAIAIEKQNAAYGTRPVRQVDGSTVDLCFNGRLHRAYERCTDARQRGDTALAAQLDVAIAQLTDAYNGAANEATKAMSDYAGACIRAGVEVEDLSSPDCQCAGCIEANAVHHVGSAMGNVRAAVWALLGDDGDGEPPIVPLMRKASSDEGARGVLWRHIVKIGDAMQVYMSECREHGEAADWRGLFA